jgi:[acyl-carrier-protein] S-malonyltransferase
VPVVSNVTAQPLTSAAGLGDELVDQITSPVRWVDSVRTMLDSGVTSFIEFGPGKVLTGLVRRIERGAEIRNVGTAAEARGIEAAAETRGAETRGAEASR